MLKIHFAGIAAMLVTVATLAACSPTFNWRDYRSPDAPFHVLFPAKPSTFSRDVNLAGLSVKMTMTAAEVDGATFAVGSAELANASQGPAALLAMKAALLNNIGANVSSEHSASASATAAGSVQRQSSIDIEASGASPNGTALYLNGRFVAREQRVYQIIVMSRSKQVAPDHVEMFLRSFSLD